MAASVGWSCRILVFIVLLASFCNAVVYEEITQSDKKERCFGMYSKDTIPGAKIEPFIRLDFDEVSGNSEVEFLTYAILLYDDIQYLGYKHDNITEYFCTQQLKTAGHCGQAEVGGYIYDSTRSKAKIDSGVYESHTEVQYGVEKKGYYCIMLHSTPNIVFNVTLEIQNPYGDIPASIYPYLPFYGFVGLAYLVIGLVWVVLCACYWREILHFQVYVSGVIFLCMFEMTMEYAYYADYNESGVSSNALMSVAVILNAARNSASFVALLVVCMGYGLLKPTLGTTAHKVIGLGFAHFIFGTLFTASTMMPSNNQKMVALIFIFPLAITLTIFYSWTISSLNVTLKKLEIRRQTTKMSLYKKLWRLIMLSIIILFIFLILNIIQKYDESYQIEHWDTIWFTTDGWIHLLYFFMFIVIAFLWRPMKNNSRYGMIEVAAGDESTFASSGKDTVKMRKMRKKNEQKGDDSDDDLKWVEDNLPSDDEPQSSFLEDDEEKIARRELQKIN